MVKDYKELIEALREMDLSECPSEYPTLCVGKDCVVLQAADAIEDLLAAVPKQGEWLPHPNPQFTETEVCSVCGIGTRKMYHCTDGVQEWDEKMFFRYCPWCGAKMQEPPEEG